MASHFTWTFVLVLFALVLPALIGQAGFYYKQLNDDNFLIDVDIPDNIPELDTPNLLQNFWSFISNTFVGLWHILSVLPIALSFIIASIYIVMFILIIRQVIGFS